MRLKTIRNPPEELIVKTAKRAGEVFWKYSVASQFLLRSFEPISDDKAIEGGIALIVNDEKFERMKQLISLSKIVRKLVEAKGLAMKITGRIEEEEFIDKIRNLPGVRSFNCNSLLNMSGQALLEVIKALIKLLACANNLGCVSNIL